MSALLAQPHERWARAWSLERPIHYGATKRARLPRPERVVRELRRGRSVSLCSGLEFCRHAGARPVSLWTRRVFGSPDPSGAPDRPCPLSLSGCSLSQCSVSAPMWLPRASVAPHWRGCWCSSDCVSLVPHTPRLVCLTHATNRTGSMACVKLTSRSSKLWVQRLTAITQTQSCRQLPYHRGAGGRFRSIRASSRRRHTQPERRSNTHSASPPHPISAPRLRTTHITRRVAGPKFIPQDRGM